MSAFMKAMRFVGDLDDEFYADERQRDVWNEASAVGFQVLNWGLVIAAAVLPWAAGRTGAWIALGLLVAWATASFLVQSYARHLNVDVYVVMPLWSPRSVAMVAVYLVAAAGVILRLVLADSSEMGSTLSGALVGGAFGVAAVLWWISRSRRNARREDAALEAAEAERVDGDENKLH